MPKKCLVVVGSHAGIPNERLMKSGDVLLAKELAIRKGYADAEFLDQPTQQVFYEALFHMMTAKCEKGERHCFIFVGHGLGDPNVSMGFQTRGTTGTTVHPDVGALDLRYGEKVQPAEFFRFLLNSVTSFLSSTTSKNLHDLDMLIFACHSYTWPQCNTEYQNNKLCRDRIKYGLPFCNVFVTQHALNWKDVVTVKLSLYPWRRRYDKRKDGDVLTYGHAFVYGHYNLVEAVLALPTATTGPTEEGAVMFPFVHVRVLLSLLNRAS